MIVFDLECSGGVHRFEGWFKSSEDFALQQDRGLVACPRCGSAEVGKAPMAPRLARKGNQDVVTRPSTAPAASDQPQALAAPSLPPGAIAAMHALAAMQAEAIKDSRWVGDKFAAESRAMHYGDADQATIHGQATREEAQDLLEEGIMVVPLLIPVAPPDEIN
ncbi:MAG: DUF1178 family protein [Novosphingobium sp.]|nr:DUF1178 family protein [Novosphingobium sp.]